MTINVGSAYVFKLVDAEWSFSEIFKLVASDAAADDSFGYSLSMHHNYTVVSALQDDDKGSNSGFIWVSFNNIFVCILVC